MGVLTALIATTFIAGVASTGLGGLVGALLQKDSNRTVSLLLSFASGVMLSVVCFDLVTEAIDTGVGIYTVIGAVALGVAVIYALNYLIDRKTNPEVPHLDAAHSKTADDLDELIHSNHLEVHQAQNGSRLSLLVAGMVMACAIALHNLPEGMTIGASYASNGGVLDRSAFVLAVILGLHDIPEGMAISVPLISGGMSRGKAVILTALSGLPTVLGALIGYAIGGMGAVGLALSLGFASGAMLYVVFGETIPQAILMYRSKLPAFSVIIGILTGLLIIFA
ncbi:MAG: ZIP family metal transporter [Oscillospiraceae bacterium]|nr:ZIP family metal transporter [Oscillospiraceae bacterium]